MTIEFECPRCKQSLSAEDSDITTRIACPTCNHSFALPASAHSDRPSDSCTSRQFSPDNSASQSSALANASLEATSKPVILDIQRHSGWATFMTFVGFFAVVIGGFFGLFLLLLGNEYDKPVGISLLIIACSGVSCLFLAFLINVFTDIRWLLKQLVDKQ